MSTLTAELRDVIRKARDEHVRSNLRELHGCCVGCGTEHSNWTLGCKPCYNRHRRARDKTGHHPKGDYWYKTTLAAHTEVNRPRNGGQRARSV